MGDGDGRQAAQELAAAVLAQVPALTDLLVETIQGQNPGYRAVNVVADGDLRRSCHDNLTRVLQLLVGGGDPAGEGPGGGPADCYDAARATGRLRAVQRMPLDDVLRSFRMGGRLVWQALIGEARARGMAGTEELLQVATRLWEVVDTTSAQLAAAYHLAEQELLHADGRRRAALWEGLVQGSARDPGFAFEAGRMLGLPVAGRYAAVAADHRPDDEERAALLRRRLAARGIGSAWQVRGDTLAGLLSLGEAALDRAVGVLRATLTAPAGVSPVVDGLAATEAAYRQAALARRTVPAGCCEVAALDDRLPEALLLASPELAQRLAARWLAPLAGVAAPERRLLLGTLHAWVATGGSVVRTAEAVHCHRNTVLNRLRRLETLTGHDFAGGTVPVDLSLALRAAGLSAPGQLPAAGRAATAVRLAHSG